jgi:hypothetical protein
MPKFSLLTLIISFSTIFSILAKDSIFLSELDETLIEYRTENRHNTPFERKVHSILPASECPWAGEDQAICLGECVEIGCQNINLGESLCVSWSPEESISDLYDSHNTIVEVCPTETTLYTIVITNDEGDIIDTDEVLVTVLNPEVTISTSSSGPICNGQQIILEAHMTGGNPSSYLWNTGETTPSIIVSPEASSVYEVQVMEELSGCIITNDVVVDVYFSSDLEISASRDVICETDSDTFTEGEGTNKQYSITEDCSFGYSWLSVNSTPGDIVEWSTGENTSLIKVIQAGDYYVTITRPSGCMSIASYKIESCANVEITLAEYEVDGTTTTFLDAGGGFDTYTWSTGENTQMIETFGIGEYSVTVTNSEGCIGRDTEIIESCDTPTFLIVLYRYINYSDLNNRRDCIIACVSNRDSNGEEIAISESIKDFVQEKSSVYALAETDTREYFYMSFDENNICSISNNEDITPLNLEDGINQRWFPIIAKFSSDKIEQVYFCGTADPYSYFKTLVGYSDNDPMTNDAPDRLHSPYVESANGSIRGNDLLADMGIQMFPNTIDISFDAGYGDQTSSDDINSLFNLNGNPPISPTLRIDFSPTITTSTNFVLVRESNGNQEVLSSGEELQLEEGTQALFKIGWFDDQNVLQIIETIGGEDDLITNTEWEYSHAGNENGTVFGVPNLSIIVHSSIVGASSVPLTLEIGYQQTIEIFILSSPANINEGYQPTDGELTEENKFDSKGQNEVIDYVQAALTDISSNNLELYNSILGNSDREVNIILREKAEDDRFTPFLDNSIIYAYNNIDFAINNRLVLTSSSIESFISGGSCEFVADYVLKASADELQAIKLAISSTENDDVPTPAVVDRILAYDNEVGTHITSWCENSDPQDIPSFIEAFDQYKMNKIIGYIPTEQEISESLFIGSRANIVLNYDAMLDPTTYARVNFCNGCTSTDVSIDTWYEKCGNDDWPCPQYNPGSFREDLNEIRTIAFTRTIGHEIGHLKHKIESTSYYAGWHLLRKNQQAKAYLRSHPICYPGTIPGNENYCATHGGHELGNEDNDEACNAESAVVDPDNIASDGKIVIFSCPL